MSPNNWSIDSSHWKMFFFISTTTTTTTITTIIVSLLAFRIGLPTLQIFSDSFGCFEINQKVFSFKNSFIFEKANCNFGKKTQKNSNDFLVFSWLNSRKLSDLQIQKNPLLAKIESFFTRVLFPFQNKLDPEKISRKKRIKT